MCTDLDSLGCLGSILRRSSLQSRHSLLLVLLLLCCVLLPAVVGEGKYNVIQLL